jgi:fructose-1,6-bisphosphatase/inositol monophosphatase family enzyme
MGHFGKDAPIVLDNLDHDLKIETDQTSEAAICKTIQRQFPKHAIVSEECGLKKGPSEFTWIIDPLDGTVNYFFDLPFFCTCVACYHTPLQNSNLCESPNSLALYNSRPLVGVVYAPYFDWMFCAASGQGATWNGLPLRNQQELSLKDAVVGISFGSRESVIAQMETVTARLLRQAKKIRMFGATGLDLAQVAKGAISGLVQLHVNLWDFAAARLILAESGVAFEARPNSLNGWQILAAPHSLFESLKSIVDGALSEDFIVSG